MRVPQLAIALALALAPLSASGQSLESVLSFETRDLQGWSGGPRETLSQDSAVVVEGRWSGRIDRDTSGGAEDFSAFTYRIPRDFVGERLVLRGWLRTEGVFGHGGLWLRQDGSSGPVQFDNMQGRGVSGTSEWTEYEIDLPLDDRARAIYFGALLQGEGTMWVDGLQLTVDGVSTADASPFTAPAAERDAEFDNGSGIDVARLSDAQIEALTLLGRVWGFVKYHHPRARLGEVNWDYELFRVAPAVMGATGRSEAREAISGWLDRVGEVPEWCQPCVQPAYEATLAAEVTWIGDRELLSPALSERLEATYRRRPSLEAQYYVGQVGGVGNPDFSNEEAYASWELPDAGYRLLALFRYWNMIQYWFPYRDLIPGDWEAALREFVPRVMLAATATEYRLAMMELIARIHDTHANLVSHLELQPPRGSAQLPVVVRLIDRDAVVTGYSDPALGPATGLRLGDVIQSIDGRTVTALVSEWEPFYSASNETTRLRNIARNLTRGPEGAVRVSGIRRDGAFELTVERVPLAQLDRTVGQTHDRPGPAFQRLSDEVAYLKLSSVVAADIPMYLQGAEGADALVVDIRNYPSEFVVFALGGHLVTRPTPFARFTTGSLTNPGAFIMGEPLSLRPLRPHFDGRVAILVDETSVSQAEYTAMALRAAPGAIVVGSTTAGADGNVSPIALPGGLRTLISGIGVFYPDGRPTQQIGIVPDVEVRPSLQGIREGRDEVLEAAVSRLLGREWRLENE